MPLRRIEMSKNELLRNVLKPFFSGSIGSCLFKGQVIEIQEHEFFVKYCRPFFGAISNGTEVKMDSSMPKAVRVVRVAPIWPTQEAFNTASRKANETIKLVRNEILQPYFFGGLSCYLEKGETIKIAGHEFFINECQPRTGIVDQTSVIEVEIGFTAETFQKKQVLADQRYAERLQQQMSASQGGGHHQHHHRSDVTGEEDTNHNHREGPTDPLSMESSSRRQRRRRHS